MRSGLECNTLVFGKSLEQLNKAIADQASMSLAFGLLKSLRGFLVKSARYSLIFAPNCRGGLGVGFRFLGERNLVNAVSIVVDADRVLGRDADELAMVPHAWQLALDHVVRVVLCHDKWKLASNIFELLLGSVVSNQYIVSRGSGSNKLWILAVCAFALGVTLDQTLESKIGAAQLLDLRKLLLDTVVGLRATVLGGLDDFKHLCMVLVPVVLNAPRRRLVTLQLAIGGFGHISNRLQRIHRLKNLPQLVGSDRIRVTVAALQNIAIVAIALLISLDNDVGSSKNGPGIIDTAPVILDRSGVHITELGALHEGILGLGDRAFKGEVRRALVTLVDDALVVFLGDHVADLLVSEGSLAGSDCIDDLSGDFTQSWNFITPGRLFLCRSLIERSVRLGDLTLFSATRWLAEALRIGLIEEVLFLALARMDALVVGNADGIPAHAMLTIGGV